MIGSLKKLKNRKPNICFVVNTLSQYMVEPRHVHLVAVKHVMRYHKGTLDCVLIYTADTEFKLFNYTDSNCVGIVEHSKRNSGCCFCLGSSVISWLRRKKKSVSLSTAKAKYIAACSTFSEAVWLRKLLERLSDIEMDATDIYCDNQSCIKFTENSMFHDKSNNIKIKYHYIGDMV